MNLPAVKEHCESLEIVRNAVTFTRSQVSVWFPCVLLLCLWMIVYDRWSGSRTSRSTAVDCSGNREKLPEQNNELIALAVHSPTELCREALHALQPLTSRKTANPEQTLSTCICSTRLSFYSCQCMYSFVC